MALRQDTLDSMCKNAHRAGCVVVPTFAGGMFFGWRAVQPEERKRVRARKRVQTSLFDIAILEPVQ